MPSSHDSSTALLRTRRSLSPWVPCVVTLLTWITAGTTPSLRAAPPFGEVQFETVTLTSNGPVATLQLAFVENAVRQRHPVILMLGSLKPGELPEWSSNLVREGFMLAAFTVGHPPDPDPRRRAQWLVFDERFAHSYVSGGLRTASDTRRILDHLLTRPDVDGDKVGWMGSSTTGIFGLAAAVHEKRLKAIVAFVATGAYERWLDTWKPNGLWRSGTNDLWPETRSLLPQADPIHWVTNLFPCAVLLVSGGKDKVVDPASARAFVDAATPHYRADPDRLRLLVYEGKTHNLPADVVALHAEHWFRLYLHPSRPPPAPRPEALSLQESARRTAINATPHEQFASGSGRTNDSPAAAPRPKP